MALRKKFPTFANVNELKTSIITQTDSLPATSDSNFFHSRRLFELCRATPRLKPYMVVVETAEGRVVAHMLAIVRYRTSWFPPYLYSHCRVMGEGVYDADISRETLFGTMLEALRRKLQNRVLYIEVSNVSQKMFAYKEFKQAGFFPVHWSSIHNSLHSRTPEERITDKRLRRIKKAYQKGLTTGEVTTPEDFRQFSILLRRHNILKPKRYIPDDAFFHGILKGGGGRLFVTKYKGHVIGCSVCVYSENNTYLWYAAYRRKSYAFLHPDILTVWHTIKDAHSRGYDHIFFLDTGLPYSKSRFREFILSFGGKPVSTFRWFRFSIGWLNRIASWIYHD